jgi:lipopolysaccharide/colanic/teichoic acid biosynthesis glycosyltransferase
VTLDSMMLGYVVAATPPTTRVGLPGRTERRRPADVRIQRPERRRLDGRHATRTDALDADLFRDALLRERRRADRFDQPFLLLVVSLKGVPDADRLRLATAVMAALRAISRDADTIGWLRHGRILGLLITRPNVIRRAWRQQLSTALRRELAARLPSSVAAVVKVHISVQAGSDATRRQAGFHPERALRTSRARARTVLRELSKRALDVVGSLLFFAAGLPLFVVVALVVKLTSAGPILFRQERVGQSGELFTMLKFRTMYSGADESLHQQYVTQFITTNSAAARTGDRAVYKLVDDPRITPVGHFLRKTSLDELPQFWNVLRGDMSLVGPRPPLLYEVKRYKRWHHRRVLDAKPGITGLWQVIGRSRTTFDEMVRLDLRYARTRSLWRDIRILLATPRAVISGRGAR